MKETPSLDDIALFLAVAETGSLSGAARRTGASLPTLSRRMTELERSLGTRLFLRGASRYALTAAGRRLADEVSDLTELRMRLARFRAAETAPRVRITAGLWTSRYLARAIAGHWSPSSSWVPEFVASNAPLDIARRAADIGVRNRRPEQAWLAGRMTAPVAYAIYASSAEVSGFVALSQDAADTPSERWLRATHGEDIVTTASDARLAFDLALAGIGRIVMPCFAGDAEPGLVRLSGPIAELGHDEWLVSHHEARHDPPVRAALDALYAALTAKARSGT